MDIPTGSCVTDELKNAQQNFERRFSCPVCLDPKLEMVVSSCQHRICISCLYDEHRELKKAMAKCPTCQRNNAFPETRPDVPEDNIEIQRQLGVTECPMDGCTAGLWMWDVEKHIVSCPFAVMSPTKAGSKKKRGRKSIKKEEKESVRSPKRQKAAPAANAPATNAPTTNAPTTNAPTTNAPATNAPTTNAPATNTPSKHAKPATNRFPPRVTRSNSNLNRNTPRPRQPLLDNRPRWCLRSAPPCSQYFHFNAPVTHWQSPSRRGFSHPYEYDAPPRQRPYYYE